MRFLVLVGLFVWVSDVEAQLLTKGVCTLDARSSLVLQQVDGNGMPVPFDCANTKVSIQSHDFKSEIKPGAYSWCPSEVHRNSKHKERLSAPVPILYESPDTYDVTVTRFDQVTEFKGVVVELDEGGCHARLKRIEVMFDHQG